MRAQGQRPRGLPVCLPGSGGPQGILRVHAVYFAELAGRKEVADGRAGEIGSGIQRGLNASIEFPMATCCRSVGSAL